MKITEMKQGVKNPNRVNVFVDSVFAFSLDVAQVVELKLKVGLEISESQLAEFKNASDFGKLYQRALEWVLVRPRSIREAKEYLWRKLKTSFEGNPQLLRGPSDEPREDGREERPEKDRFKFSEEIINLLIERGYLDDRAFAEWYVENRFVKKGISKKRLRLELVKKGISNEIIDEVLDKRNDEEEIRKIIAKKWGKYENEKLIQYLVRQGFSFELARELVRTYEKD